MARPKKRRARIRIRQKALVQKKDKTNVAIPDTTRYQKAPIQMPRDNGLNMRVKIRRKTK